MSRRRRCRPSSLCPPTRPRITPRLTVRRALSASCTAPDQSAAPPAQTAAAPRRRADTAAPDHPGSRRQRAPARDRCAATANNRLSRASATDAAHRRLRLRRSWPALHRRPLRPWPSAPPPPPPPPPPAGDQASSPAERGAGQHRLCLAQSQQQCAARCRHEQRQQPHHLTSGTTTAERRLRRRGPRRHAADRPDPAAAATAERDRHAATDHRPDPAAAGAAGRCPHPPARRPPSSPTAPISGLQSGPVALAVRDCPKSREQCAHERALITPAPRRLPCAPADNLRL